MAEVKENFDFSDVLWKQFSQSMQKAARSRACKSAFGIKGIKNFQENVSEKKLTSNGVTA